MGKIGRKPSERFCKACGDELPHVLDGQRYRSQSCPNDECSKKARKTHKKKPLIHDKCQWCGKSFVRRVRTRPEKFCSTGCVGCSTKRKLRMCKWCGQFFRPKQTGRNTFCSIKCSNLNYEQRRSEYKFEIMCIKCNKAGLAKSDKGRVCLSCKLSQNRERSRLECNHRKRARKFGVEYVRFNPLDVFERDGWKCGICGSNVPQNAPQGSGDEATLDHIIPMSRGGDHVPDNTQIAHRRCNSKKHKSLPTGELF